MKRLKTSYVGWMCLSFFGLQTGLTFGATFSASGRTEYLEHYRGPNYLGQSSSSRILGSYSDRGGILASGATFGSDGYEGDDSHAYSGSTNSYANRGKIGGRAVSSFEVPRASTFPDAQMTILATSQSFMEFDDFMVSGPSGGFSTISLEVDVSGALQGSATRFSGSGRVSHTSSASIGVQWSLTPSQTSWQTVAGGVVALRDVDDTGAGGGVLPPVGNSPPVLESHDDLRGTQFGVFSAVLPSGEVATYYTFERALRTRAFSVPNNTPFGLRISLSVTSSTGITNYYGGSPYYSNLPPPELTTGIAGGFINAGDSVSFPIDRPVFQGLDPGSSIDSISAGILGNAFTPVPEPSILGLVFAGMLIFSVSGRRLISRRNRSRSTVGFAALCWTLALLAPGIATAQFVIDQPADLVLGQESFSSSALGEGDRRMDSPNDVAVDPRTGHVFVADTNNHRVLRFPPGAGMFGPAEAVLGQPNFLETTEGTTVFKMNSPWGIACDTGGRLWVADWGNNRILRFDDASRLPSGAPANGVLGQVDFTTGTPGLSINKIAAPQDVAVDPLGTLWVADTGNNRVLRFANAAQKGNGDIADGVLGQPTLFSGAVALSVSGMSEPEGLAVSANGTLFVADSLNRRVLRFDDAAAKAKGFGGANADAVLGQPGFTTAEIAVTASGMNRPSGLSIDSAGTLYVADRLIRRVLVFTGALTLGNGSAATGVLGQPNFFTAGPVDALLLSSTRFGKPTSLATGSGGVLWVSDRDANRVLRFSPDRVGPVVEIAGNRRRVSRRSRMILRGTANDLVGISSVVALVNRARPVRASGTTEWSVKLRLKERRNTVRVIATDLLGNSSRPAKITVIRNASPRN